MATLNPNLRPFWESRCNERGEVIRFRVLYGGRMSSKSHDAAGMAIARANHHTERFLCMRMYQNRIADSVYTLLKDKISAFKLDNQFRVYADAIEHRTNGSLFRFYGIMRNVDDIKSFEGCTVGWIEEAHNLTETMFTTIRPTIMRNDGGEFWFTFNPRFSNDYAWRRLVVSPPEGSLVHLINYDRNPFLAASALADIASEFREDPELADHVYNGSPLTDTDGAIIKRSFINAAIDAHLKLPEINWSEGVNTLGYDVADGGADLNATVSMNGRICTGVDKWKGEEDELDVSAKRAVRNAKASSCIKIGYDSLGVGASSGIHLRNAGWNMGHVFKFKAGGKVVYPDRKYGNTKVLNKDMFKNLKAQAWWHVADLFRNTFNAVTKGQQFKPHELISLSSADIEPKILNELITELSTPKRDFDGADKVMVESKDDLKKREVASPNLADAFIISNARTLAHRGDIGGML